MFLLTFTDAPFSFLSTLYLSFLYYFSSLPSTSHRYSFILSHSFLSHTFYLIFYITLSLSHLVLFQLSLSLTPCLPSVFSLFSSLPLDILPQPHPLYHSPSPPGTQFPLVRVLGSGLIYGRKWDFNTINTISRHSARRSHMQVEF